MKTISTFILCFVICCCAIFNTQAQVTSPIIGAPYGIVFDGGESYTANGRAMTYNTGTSTDCQAQLTLTSYTGTFATNQTFYFEATGNQYNGYLTYYLKQANDKYVKNWDVANWCHSPATDTGQSEYYIVAADGEDVYIRQSGSTNGLGVEGAGDTYVHGSRGNGATGYWKIIAVGTPLSILENLITTAQTLSVTVTGAAGVKSYLDAAIIDAQAVTDAEDADDAAYSAATATLQSAIALVNSFKISVTAANTILASEGTIPPSQGWTTEADATLTAAIATANAVDSDATLISAAIAELNAAVITYKAAELVPRFNADETKKYRILITDNEGNYVRYMAKDPSSNKAVPKAKDVAIDPDLQLWYLHPVAGVTDGYKLQNVSTNEYLAANGERISSTAGNARTWVAVYNKSLTTSATTSAKADGAWFRLNDNGNADNYWSHDGGTWPDAVNNMWVNKGVSGTRGSLFQIEEDIDPSIAFEVFKTEFLAYVAEVQTLYNTTVSGTLPGQYTGKPELADAIAIANTAYSESTLLPELVAAKLALEEAVTAYQSTQISPYVGYAFRLKHYSSENYLSRSTDGSYTNARIQPLGTLDSDQVFEFESVPGIANGVRLKTIGEEEGDVYVASHSGYTSTWTTTPDASGADMVIVKGEDYILLGFTNGASSIASRNYFGAQGTDANASVYTDNDGQNEVHRWVMEIIDPKVNLSLAIADATNKLELAVVGTGVGQYPQTAVDSLTNTVAMATVVYDNEEAESADIDAAILDLQTTLSWFANIPVARDALHALISAAISAKQAAVVGTEIGQYQQSTIDIFTNNIAAAQAVADNADATDADINVAAADMQTALTWFINVPLTRAELSALITSANTKLEAATPGSAMGEYPQEAIDALTNAIATAQAVAYNSTASEETVSAALSTLQTALDLFISQEISHATQYYGKDWNIVHASGNLLSKTTSTAATVNILNTAGALQVFQIVPVPGFTNTVAIKSSDNTYLQFSGWNTSWGNDIEESARVVISNTDNGFVRIKFVGNNYLGTNTDNALDSAECYADKNGNALAHRWILQTSGQVIKIRLQNVIGVAQALLDVSTAGTESYNFPQTAYDTFSQAIAAANSVFDNVATTQSEVDAAVITLQAAIDLYYTQQILPLFEPVENTQYIITNKAYTGYFKHSETKAIVEAMPPVLGWEFVNVRDSVWVLKSGTKALAKSLNMVDFDATQIDQQWYVHYSGKRENNIYVKDESDTKDYFSFSANGAFNNTIQQSSTTLLEIVPNYNPGSQNQWFTIAELGAPISTALAAKIVEATTALTNTVVGGDFGNYPQEAKDILTTARDEAQAILDNAAELTQQEINDATESLNASLVWFFNQRVVWKPEANMAYYIGNRDNVNYLSVDTENSSLATGYKFDSVPIANQVWFFVPVENKAGFYQLVNGNRTLITAGGASVAIGEYSVANSLQMEVVPGSIVGDIQYYTLITSNTYPNIHIDSNGNVGTDRYTYNNYQIKLVPAGLLRTEILLSTNLLDSLIVGNQFGQIPQTAYNEFLDVITASIANAKDGDDTNDDVQLDLLLAAKDAYRAAENGKGLDLDALTAAIGVAQGFIDETTVIGEEAGECPQSVIDALTAAVSTAKDATGIGSQTDIDDKVSAVNEAVENFKIALKVSTGLADLIGTSEVQLAAAVEGAGAGQYVIGSKATFEAAINAAVVALAVEPVSQSALLEAVNTLTVALDNFNAAQNPPVYTEDLATVIAEAQEFLKDKLAGEYTALRALLLEAQAVLANPSVTQDEIDIITDELAVALEDILTGINDVYGSEIAVYSANGMLKIEGLQGVSFIKVYNVLGQIVFRSTSTGNKFEQSLDRGFYIVRINSTVNKKVMIK